jgi:seryl-tRNA synthetase
MALDPSPALDGHVWYPNGQSAYSGAALRLYRKLDDAFVSFGDSLGAVEHAFPPFIPATEMAKLDYFRSFQHLATFPIALDPSSANLQRFVAEEPLDESGAIRLTECCPTKDVLTPSACYHFYILLQNQRIDATRHLTTRATCFRREAAYTPLERQWAFGMRELVCIGTEADVTGFLSQMRERVDAFCKRVDLPVRWDKATDPFFNPAQNPKYIAQKLSPIKSEIIFGKGLAIGSVNYHRTYFGETFGMTLPSGEPAFSGCIGFGLDRWVYAWKERFGANESNWPTL